MFINIDNIKIEYDYKKTENKTLVFLHGFGGNLKNFESIYNTFYNFGYSCLNINLTEYGFKKVNLSFSIYNYAEIVFKLIKRLKIKNAVLIGHSFGGRIAIILSSMFNDLDVKFSKLVLIDSAGIKPKFNLLTKIKILKFKYEKKQVLKNKKDKSVLEKYGSNDYKTVPDYLKKIFNNIVNEELSYLLGFIKQKTLIIFGKNDRETPLYMAKKLNKNIEKSQLILLNGGHYCYLDDKQSFINIFKKFIE